MGVEGHQSELILIPAPSVGHLVSAGEFAKRILSLSSSTFSHITLLLIRPPFLGPQVDAFASSFSFSDPRFTCLSLPLAPPPPPDLFARSEESFYTLWIEAHADSVRHAVQDRTRQAGGTQPAAFIMDFFCSSFADIANELQIPYYIYSPSGAAMVSLMLHLPTRHVTTEFSPSDPKVSMTGFANPVPPCVLPSACFNTEGGYTAFLKMARRFRECKGIIVNTFAEIETYALDSLAEDKGVPPIYPVGPVIDLKGEGQKKMGSTSEGMGSLATTPRGTKFLNWLDKQPTKSVVFLCFGSMVELHATQIREIATGLEQSGHSFLWSFRGPHEGPADAADLLPDGFLERTKSQGMVCGWVPQVDILAHAAIGGFVTHCGWNSVLESVWHGVPVATWPMHAEQQINAFMLVKELGLAVELRMDYRKNGTEVVGAEEVAAAVKAVMRRESEERGKVEELRERSRAALEEGGSSYNAMGQLAEDMASAQI